MNSKILLIFFVFTSLLSAQEFVNVDSILDEYEKLLLEVPDSVLFLGEVSIKWRGKGGEYYTVDSGICFSFRAGNRYISVESEKNGLFHFVVAKEGMPIHSIAVRYDTLLLSIAGWEYGAFLFSGISFAGGETGSSDYSWRVVFSDSIVKVLEDFVAMHPAHSFCPQASALLEDFKLISQIEDMLNSNLFESAKNLLLSRLKLRPSSKFMGFILGELALRWAKMELEMGSTKGAINILNGFITLGNQLGNVGCVSNLYVISSLLNRETEGFYTQSGDLGNEIRTEVVAYFLSNFVSEKDVYLFKYDSYISECNHKKIEELCRNRLKKYPKDSLAYEHLINNQTNIDSAIKLAREAIKKKVPISDGTIASIGSICYAENRFKEAVYFFEKVGDVANKFGLYYFNCYLKALVKNGRKDEAKQQFLGALKDKTQNDTLSHRDYHYIIESAIALNLANIVKQFYSMAQTKLKPVALLYLRTSMSRWFCDNKEKEMAFKVLNDALKDTIASQIYWAMGDCYKNFANYDSAEISYKKAIEISNSNWDKLNIILALGDIYLQVGDKDKIIIMLNDILSEIKEPADYIDKIKKWCNDNNANDILDQLSQPNETVEEQTPEEPVKESDPKINDLKNNMHTFQVAVEDFSTRADGYYPASFDVRVSDFGNPENLTVLELLPTNYKNPYDSTFAPVVLSLIDPPDWSKIKLGQVVYVPINIKGKGATKYKIYGKSEKGPLTLILTP